MSIHARGTAGNRLGYLGIAALLLLGGCNDSSAPDQLVAPAPPALSLTATSVGDPADFDHFAADVAIQARSDAAVGGGTLSHATRFRVDRGRGAEGKWSTTFTFDEAKPQGVGRPRDQLPGLARLELADDGSARAFDHAGRVVDLDAGTRAYETIQQNTALQNKGRPPFAYRPPQRPDARAREARAWVEAMVLTPTARARAREGIERRFGKPQGKVRGLDRYAAQRQDAAMEMLVDPATGLVAEQTLTRGGKVAQKVKYEYRLVGDGVYVPASAHAEFPTQKGERAGHVVDMTISNVQLEKRGGA